METIWEFYNPERHGSQGGNYMFLLKPFQNAPFYSGQAQCFANRFTKNSRSHGKLFNEGGRTFMREPFIDGSKDRSHVGFASRWHCYKQKELEEQEKLVWVPKHAGNNVMATESAFFWNNNVSIIVSTRETDSLSVEGRVQIDIINYYKGLIGPSMDLRVPRCRSRLVGKGPRFVTGPALSYTFAGGQPMDAGSFFPTLRS